jgi:hypothetical protein
VFVATLRIRLFRLLRKLLSDATVDFRPMDLHMFRRLDPQAYLIAMYRQNLHGDVIPDREHSTNFAHYYQHVPALLVKKKEQVASPISSPQLAGRNSVTPFEATRQNRKKCLTLRVETLPALLR